MCARPWLRGERHRARARRRLTYQRRGAALGDERVGLGRVVARGRDQRQAGVLLVEGLAEDGLVGVVAQRVVDLAHGRAQTLDALVHDRAVLGRGHVDDAREGRRALDEADVHRELAVALDELLRAVEGVDAPEVGPAFALGVRQQLILLRHDGNLRVGGRERVADDGVRRRVGLGQRGPVGLEVRDGLPLVEGRLRVDLHDGVARLLRDGGDVVDDDGRLAGVEATERRIVRLHGAGGRRSATTRRGKATCSCRYRSLRAPKLPLRVLQGRYWGYTAALLKQQDHP